MITEQQVRAYFQNNHARMNRLAGGGFADLIARNDPDALEEAVHNTITLAFENALRGAKNGKIRDEDELLRFTKQSLWWGMRHTRAGRTIVRKHNADKKYGDVYEKMAAHNGVANYRDFIGKETPVPDAVSFRLDIPTFFATLGERQQAMALDLMANETTKDVAEKYAVTPGAVSQFRTRFYQLWSEFFAEV